MQNSSQYSRCSGLDSILGPRENMRSAQARSVLSGGRNVQSSMFRNVAVRFVLNSKLGAWLRGEMSPVRARTALASISFVCARCCPTKFFCVTGSGTCDDKQWARKTWGVGTRVAVTSGNTQGDCEGPEMDILLALGLLKGGEDKQGWASGCDKTGVTKTSSQSQLQSTF